MREVYSEVGLDPSVVSYMEMHGTGTPIGDPMEANNVAEVFCVGRTTPLLIGSTKTNMGHPEPASGVAALAKCLIAMHDHAIPANLHFKEPNPMIYPLQDGRMKVCLQAVILLHLVFDSITCSCFSCGLSLVDKIIDSERVSDQ